MKFYSDTRHKYEMQFHSESGLELLSRFSGKPGAINLDRILFSDDISNERESVIEIVGGACTGKKLLLCQFLAKCISPAQHEGIKIDGYDACAILIDTLGHIRISKIAELVSSMIRIAYQTADVQPLDELVDSIVKKSLENLTVISCCNNVQFQLTLHTLEDELLANNRIVLLAIDNILTYYWQERREKGILSMNTYVKSLIKIIRSYVCQFKTVMVYIKLEEPEGQRTKRADTMQGMGINYRLQLRKSNITRAFSCHVETADNIKQIPYTIFNSGIKWIL